MKCIIMAGGTGDRLWPLSRKNYPKQFLNLGGHSSIFQETITRNMPFCSEFIILTNQGYQTIVEGQLQQFQGLKYHIILEEEGYGTAPALTMLLQSLAKQEQILVVPSDLIIHGDNYSDAIYRAKELAEEGEITLFGIIPRSPSITYGYIRHNKERVTRFIEKPSRELADRLFCEDYTLWNCGMFLCNVNTMLRELKKYASALYKMSKTAYVKAQELNEHTTLFSKSLFVNMEPMSMDKAVLEQSEHLCVLRLRCEWNDVSDFESYEQLQKNERQELVLQTRSGNTTIINNSSDQLIVANDLKDVLIVNTSDALYVSSKEKANEIKEIMSQHYNEFQEYFDENPTMFRPWGTRELIRKEAGYRIRKLTIYPGMSLSRHLHEKRNENYAIVIGELTIELGSKVMKIGPGESYNIMPGQMHRLVNYTDEVIVAIEVDTGLEIAEIDMVHPEEAWNDSDINDTNQVTEVPSIIKLRPAYKDYLWGGTQLKERYGKQSPYDITAESWELSAHPAGPSVIDGGILDQMSFFDFVEKYGQSVSGWKSQTFDRFPILIKFIDATKSLSVQIHPDDDYAFVNEGEFGKNEVWYVIDAKPGAFLYCGLREETSKEEIFQRIENHTITEILNKVQVKANDVIFIPSGTIHAIGEGLFICEIQQSSNSTYRVWDYGRVDTDGKLRELHVKKALDVVDTSPYQFATYGFSAPEQFENSMHQVLCRCKYFESVKYDIQGEEIIRMDDSSFLSIIMISGEARISCREEEYLMHAGDSYYITAGRKRLHIEGTCEFIATNI